MPGHVRDRLKQSAAGVKKEGEQMVELDAIKYELTGFDKPLLEMGDSL